MSKHDTKVSLLKVPAVLLWGALVLALAVPLQASDTLIRVGAFSTLNPGDPLPAPWEPLKFRKIERHTRYRLVADGDQTVLAAQSRQSASGLIRRVSIDLRTTPYFNWRWKVTRVYSQGDATRKDGDDYPAIIYITFAYDPERVGFLERAKFEAARLVYGETPPMAVLNYIWANRVPRGSFVPNAYTSRAIMIAIQSGPALAGRWITEKRNVYADYKKAFGREPTAITGVAIMTDTDNTGESGQAWYGDIFFSAE